MTVTISSTHIVYPRRDGQAESTWVAWSNTKMVHLWTVTHLSTNPAQRWATSFVWPTYEQQRYCETKQPDLLAIKQKCTSKLKQCYWPIKNTCLLLCKQLNVDVTHACVENHRIRYSRVGSILQRQQ